MDKRIGIPRALFYYYLFPLWDVFFRELGYQVVLSPPTDKHIVNLGVERAVDEVCYPVKICYGHVASLLGKTDYLFLPRLVSIQERSYICPKFMGLPDMIRASFPEGPQLIDHTFDGSRRKEGLRRDLEQLGKQLGHPLPAVRQACQAALAALRDYEAKLAKGQIPLALLEGKPIVPTAQRFKVALLGHGYNLYDPYASMRIVEKLAKLGVAVVTAENVPQGQMDAAAQVLPKRMFWTLGHRVLGSALYLQQQAEIAGIIHVASFGCGPDSLVAELVERYLKRVRQKPFLSLTIDEHTGEAGLDTRLEAFIDMIARRQIS